MAVLINGNGNPAVYANQDADWFASIMGNTTAITGVGQQFAATQEDANTISVADGVIITKEGRRIQLDANESDIFDIPTGTQGTTSYYIIGYHLVTDETSAQSCDTFVQLMDNGTDTIDEDTFRGGADEVYVSLYRVTQTGLNITAIDLLLPTVSNLSQISTTLTANGNVFKYSYSGGKYGYTVGGIFYPFKSGLEETTLWTNSSPTSSFATQAVTLSQSIANFEYIKLTIRRTTSNSEEFSAIYSVADVQRTAVGSGYWKMNCMYYNNSGTAAPFRAVSYISNTSFNFGSGLIKYGETPDNTLVIPVKISGLKFA